MYTGFGDRINAKMLNFTKPYRVDGIHTLTQLLGAMRTMFDIGLSEAKAKAVAVAANGRTMVPFSCMSPIVASFRIVRLMEWMGRP